MTRVRSRTRGHRGPGNRMRTPGGPRFVAPAAGGPPLTAQPTAAPGMSRSVLAIGGLDPSGGAGVAADLKTIVAHRYHGAAVITSVTAQNTVGVQGIYDLPAEFIQQQIDSVFGDLELHAVKIGMLGTARAVELLARLIGSHAMPNVVLDPVLRSTTGTPLLERAGVTLLRELLLPRAHVVTPNMEEAAVLTGMTVNDLPSMKEAARALHRMGARCAVVTGGHLGSRAIDVMCAGPRVAVFDSTRVSTSNTHGTGCTFSTAIACQLAGGVEPAEAIDAAKRFVARAVSHSGKIGKGAGPLNHLVSPF